MGAGTAMNERVDVGERLATHGRSLHEKGYTRREAIGIIKVRYARRWERDAVLRFYDFAVLTEGRENKYQRKGSNKRHMSSIVPATYNTKDSSRGFADRLLVQIGWIAERVEEDNLTLDELVSRI
jgi:hypothetical protein